jgi:hypothetical protein
MTITKELEDLVEQVKILSANDLNAGAKILTLHTNPEFPVELFENLYQKLQVKIPDQAAQVEEYISALKQIRATCSKSADAIEYVNEQAGQMVEANAVGNFAQKVRKENKDSGCSIA